MKLFWIQSTSMSHTNKTPKWWTINIGEHITRKYFSRIRKKITSACIIVKKKTQSTRTVDPSSFFPRLISFDLLPFRLIVEEMDTPFYIWETRGRQSHPQSISIQTRRIAISRVFKEYIVFTLSCVHKWKLVGFCFPGFTYIVPKKWTCCSCIFAWNILL